MQHEGKAFSRSQLLDQVWGRSISIEERTVDVWVLRMGKLLKPFGEDNYLQTVRGIGYRFSAPSA